MKDTVIVSGRSYDFGQADVGGDDDDATNGHAFELLAVEEFEYEQENVCLIKLRNPFDYAEN